MDESSELNLSLTDQAAVQPDTNQTGNSSPQPTQPHKGVAVPFYLRNPVTSSFSVVLIAIYLLTSAGNHFEKIEDWAVYLGAFYGPAVQVGEWWRFITATLLHDNPMHLFSNVFGILAFGGMIEPIIGSWRLVLLYALSLVTGLFFSWMLNPQALTLGASTIDYGLIGAYLTIALLLRFKMDRQIFFQELRGALLFIVIFTLWNAMEGQHLNLWAHLGGLVAGVVFVILLRIQRNRT